MNCSCHQDKSCIERVPIFNSLTYDEMIEIAKITVAKEYTKGEMVYMAGDKGEKLFVIHKGKIKITRFSESGKEQVIRVLGSGDFLGELSLFVHAPLRDNGEVLEDATVCVIDGEKLKGLMVKYPTIALKVLEEISTRLDKAENLIEHLGIHDVETRIIETILAMADSKREVVLKMSKRDLASHMGMSQETLSRKLSNFQDEGWIKLVGHRRILILDEDSLRNLIG